MGRTFKRSITGKVTAVHRQGHTVYGNPIMSVSLELTRPYVNEYGTWAEGDSIRLRISDNAGIVYGIGNPEYRDEAHTFELTRADRISGRVDRRLGALPHPPAVCR